MPETAAWLLCRPGFRAALKSSPRRRRPRRIILKRKCTASLSSFVDLTFPTDIPTEEGSSGRRWTAAFSFVPVRALVGPAVRIIHVLRPCRWRVLVVVSLVQYSAPCRAIRRSRSIHSINAGSEKADSDLVVAMQKARTSMQKARTSVH